VERSGTEIAANDLTRSFYEGSRPNKKEKSIELQTKKLSKKYILDSFLFFNKESDYTDCCFLAFLSLYISHKAPPIQY
jgi:hypothetical protein